MGGIFYKNVVLVLLFFLGLFFFVSVLRNVAVVYEHDFLDESEDLSDINNEVTGFVVNERYSSFSYPEPGFTYNAVGNSVSVSDDIVFRVGYYSVNGSAWRAFNLSGNLYGVDSSWIRDSASYVLPFFGVGEHYVIVYSCSYEGNAWDCHDGNWQLFEINNSLEDNSSESCVDSCGSSGFECGVGVVCGLSVDCGVCESGFDCVGNVCVSVEGVSCGDTSCGVGEYCFNGVCLLNVSGNTYFVATNGNDNNPGTFNSPFYSWQKGVQVARPGDIVYFRGGVWTPTSHIFTSGGYDTGAIAMTIDPTAAGFGVSGTAQNPIRYYNYPGEKPIMDGRLLLPNPDRWQSGIGISNSEYIYLKGLTVRNVFQSPPDHNPATNHGKNFSEVYGIGSFDSANLRFENMVVYNINGRGFQHWGGSWDESDGPGSMFESDNTSWINCDAYNLYDRYAKDPGNAADGWKVVGYASNYYYWEGCRAWNYSDDGFDPNGAHRFFKNCWAMSTSYVQDLFDDGTGTWDPEGNGFKISGINPNYPGYSEGGEVFVRMENCIAALCVGTGVANNIEVNYEDQWPNNGVFYNNIAYRTNGGFFDLGSNVGRDSRATEYRNNIAFGSTYNEGGFYPLYEVGIYRPSVYPHSHNTWIGTMEVDGWPGWEYNPEYSVSDDDFVSVIASQLTAPRKSDGSLPDITFLHLKQGSDLIDGGTVVSDYHCATVGVHPGDDCVEWFGSAPDLGPFESNY